MNYYPNLFTSLAHDTCKRIWLPIIQISFSFNTIFTIAPGKRLKIKWALMWFLIFSVKGICLVVCQQADQYKWKDFNDTITYINTQSPLENICTNLLVFDSIIKTDFWTEKSDLLWHDVIQQVMRRLSSFLWILNVCCDFILFINWVWKRWPYMVALCLEK